MFIAATSSGLRKLRRLRTLEAWLVVIADMPFFRVRFREEPSVLNAIFCAHFAWQYAVGAKDGSKPEAC
jgi:hypothetical protein